MNARQKGIDAFRLMAAIMVIAIHTFPFGSFSPLLDEIVTLTLFRVAVPFFFMTTGYFLIGSLSEQVAYYQLKKVKQFMIKISQIYLLVVLLYLPLSFFNGTLSLKTSLIDWIKLLVFDGTFYHLWYFPGIILGTLLVSFLLKKMPFNAVFLISIGLYLIGVFGDSWYGVFKGVPFIKSFYDSLFMLMEMTRTGLFFTPLFLCLGAFIYRNRHKKTARKKELLFLVALSLTAMVVESFVLHRFFEIKHDSMYLLLPVVMYFLFLLLLKWQPTWQIKNGNELSLMMYIVHPILIVVVHTLSNKIKLIKVSFIYFLLVVIGSYLLSQLIIVMKQKIKKRAKTESIYRAEREISEKAVKHNLLEIKHLIPDQTDVIAVVKANAYGADMLAYGKLLVKNKVTFFAVATIEEGITLRRGMIPGNILILGYTDPKRAKDIAKYDLIQSIVSEDHGKMLNKQKVSIRCHLQVDTGMHRLGVAPEIETLTQMYRLPHLKIEGIYSHLGSSDSLDDVSISRTERQLITYCNLLNGLKKRKINYGVTHIQSSYGIMNYPEYNFDYVRAGVILYGFLSSEEPVRNQLDLKPAIQIKAKLISKRLVKAGEYLGYGTQIKLSKDTLIGVVSIGYADGIPRSLSNSGYGVYYQDHFLPQIGNICMDMFLVKLEGAENINVADEVVVVADFEEVAYQDQTLTNETLTQLGSRLTTSVTL